MAYNADKRRDARKAFVHDRQALATIATMLGIPDSTLRRWKRDAKAEGDDWDAQRSASTIAGGGLEQLVGQVIEDYVIAHQATLEALKTSTDISPIEKAKVLASLADAFNKTVSSAGRISPKISELGVAMDVLKRLGDFIAQRYPQHAPALLEVIEPFGTTLAEAYA